MKIAAIGNSHIGSLKKAWLMMRDNYPACDITFFAHWADELRSLEVENGCLVPGNSGLRDAISFTSDGLTSIDPNQFDVFLLYGLDASPYFHNENRSYSSSVIRRSLNDVFEPALATLLLKRLRSITDKPIFIGHTPLRVKTHEDNRRELIEYNLGLRLLNTERYLLMGAEMIPQPLETIVDGCKTEPQFSIGSRRLSVGSFIDDELHPESDKSHMNEAFGELWLRQFLVRFKHLVMSKSAWYVPRHI